MSKEPRPDVGGAVAAALAAGHSPHDIERAVITELRKQAQDWARHEGGAWYEVYVCPHDGVDGYFPCQRVTANAAGVALCVFGSERRKDIPIREWIANNGPLPEPSAPPVALVSKKPTRAADLFSHAGIEL